MLDPTTGWLVDLAQHSWTRYRPGLWTMILPFRFGGIELELRVTALALDDGRLEWQVRDDFGLLAVGLAQHLGEVLPRAAERTVRVIMRTITAA